MIELAKKKSDWPAQGDQLLQHMPELGVLWSVQPWGLPTGPFVATWGYTWAARTKSAPRPLRSSKSSSPSQLWLVPAAAGPLFTDEIQGRRTWKPMIEKLNSLQNKWDEAIFKCLHFLSTIVWLLQKKKKATYKKRIRLPPLLLTVTHFQLLSLSRFGFAYVLTGPATG